MINEARKTIHARCCYCTNGFYMTVSATVAAILEQEGTTGAVCDAADCNRRVDAALRRRRG